MAAQMEGKFMSIASQEPFSWLGFSAAASAGLPAAAADGTVSMTIHQVNGDGAG